MRFTHSLVRINQPAIQQVTPSIKPPKKPQSNYKPRSSFSTINQRQRDRSTRGERTRKLVTTSRRAEPRRQHWPRLWFLRERAWHEFHFAANLSRKSLRQPRLDSYVCHYAKRVLIFFWERCYRRKTAEIKGETILGRFSRFKDLQWWLDVPMTVWNSGFQPLFSFFFSAMPQPCDSVALIIHKVKFWFFEEA